MEMWVWVVVSDIFKMKEEEEGVTSTFSCYTIVEYATQLGGKEGGLFGKKKEAEILKRGFCKSSTM